MRIAAIFTFIFFFIIDASICTSSSDSAPATLDELEPHMSLLQTLVRYRKKAAAGARPGEDSVEDDYHDNETLLAQEAGLVGSSWVETCGTRLVQPQLQFDLQIFYKFGLVNSPYAHCELMSMKSLASLGLGDAAAQNLTVAYAHMAPQRNHGMAKAFMGVWGLLAMYFFVLLVLEFYSGSKKGMNQKVKAQQLAEKLHVRAVWQHGLFHWLSLSWLDPLIGFYRQLGTTEIGDPRKLDLVTPASSFTPQRPFEEVWDEEVASKGLAKADLIQAIWEFLGTRTVIWLLFAAGVAVLLEFVGLAIVLDVLLNYLEWAQMTQLEGASLYLDMLAPTVMIVILGFAAPMAARAFTAMLNFWDGCATDRLVAGMLVTIHSKCQRIKNETDDDDNDESVARADLAHLLNNDILRMWRGALMSYAYLIVVPICIAALMCLLVWKLGWSAIIGAATTCWICMLYVPISRHVRLENMQWQTSTDARLRAMKDMVANVRAMKSTGGEQPFSERINSLRETELDNQFSFMMSQSLLNVPLNLFPFALMFSSLFFDHIIYDRVSWQDIFVCMQILVGLNNCVTTLSTAVQKTLNMPNSLQRLQQFLREPERITAGVRPCTEGAGAPHVRLCGSFAPVEGQEPVLRNVDFQAQEGELVAVVGAPGSGKSSFLSAILGELPGAEGTVHVEAPKNVSYCGQTPWVVDGTLQENITLGETMDDERYRESLDAAAIPEEQRKAEYVPEVYAPPPGGLIDQYFLLWDICTVIVLTVSILNVRWDTTHPVMGVIVVMIQGMLHWSVLEIPLQTIATLCVSAPPVSRSDRGHLTMCLNYNLLALGEPEVDECMANKYEAYIGNIDQNVCSVLVSATNDPALKEYELKVRDDYRKQIYDELYEEGLTWAGLSPNPVEVDEGRLQRLWSKFEHVDRRVFVQGPLKTICERFAREFMVVHRVTRVLRKCGQYQDLILLSAGEEYAYTYVDKALYGKMARKEGELLFHPSEDTDNCRGRHFDYTLVLDSDTRVVKDTVFDLLEIGAAHPDRAIIQPAIKLHSEEDDTIFMHLESMRQTINESMTNAITTILGKCSFFGKGLIRNAPYMERLLGSKHKLVERVPIDVLSHDTFEAAVMQPLYANSVFLLEAPSLNYVTWDIRERRWNRGELVLMMHFWPSTVGRFLCWLQFKFQGKAFTKIHVRTASELDKVSEYVAHGALRQMAMKVFLVIYIITVDFVEMHYELAPICIVMFLIIVFPKFATCSWANWKPTFIETFSSIIQFTPEAVVGTIRVMRALKAHVTGNARWVPQKAVEDEFKLSNPFSYAVRHLWYYPVFAIICGFVVVYLVPDAVFTFILLGTLFILPVYVGLTALSTDVLWDTPRSWLKVSMQTGFEEEEADKAKAAKAAAAARAKAVPVGPRGIQLSTGQRACAALARAAYSKNSDLALLDDPFACVDAATGDHILHKLIRGPLLEQKTRIVAMAPHRDRLQHFDSVVLLSEGRVVAQGSPSQVLASPEFKKLEAGSSVSELVEANLAVTTKRSAMKSAVGKMPQAMRVDCLEQPTAEVRSTKFRWGFIWDMVRAGGLKNFFASMLLVYLLRVSTVGLMLVLGRWADGASGLGDDRYIHVVVIMAVCMMVFQILQDYFILHFSRGASELLFRRVLECVLAAPVDKFWDKQPAGRVINRLSGDVLTVDFCLSSSFASLVSFAFGVAVQQAYCLYIMPVWLVIPAYAVVGMFLKIFWDTAAPLQNLAMLALSQCQDDQIHMKSNCASATAYRYKDKLKENYSAFADIAIRLNFLCLPCSKMWLISRLAFCFCFQCTIFVLYSLLRPNTIGIGTLGVLLASTFSITQELNSFVDAMMSSIAAVVSFQRLSEYFSIPQERPRAMPDDDAMQYSSLAIECYKLGDLEVKEEDSHVVVWRRGGGPILEATPDGAALRCSGIRILQDLAPGCKEFRELSSVGPDGRIVSVNGVSGNAAEMAAELSAKNTGRVLWLNVWGPSIWQGVDIQIADLHTGYGDSMNVLREVNAIIPARSRTCLVGPAGSGKSTLFLSLLQSLEPRTGRVVMSGSDIKTIGLRALRTMVSLLPQQPVVYDGTLRSNADFSGRLPDERIWEALNTVQLSPVVRALPQGLDTVLSREGGVLSFGQRQLLCLARAVCQQPPVLLLDDCTSALDLHTQQAVMEAIAAGFPNSTVMAVVRRPEDALSFERALVFKSGTVVEQGPVRELLSKERGALAAMLAQKFL